VSQLLKQWHDNVLRHQVAPSAAENYKTIADHHIVPTLGRKWVSRLATTDINRLISTKMDAGLSVSTVRRIRSVLVQALDEAVRWGIVGRNVGKATKGPKDTTRRAGRTLTPDQAKALLEAAKTHRLGALYVVMLSLGLRRGEALGLRWDDIDFEEGILTVRQAMRYEAGRVFAGEVKTPKSRRSVNVPDELLRVLKAHRAAQADERLKAGELWVDSGLVFTTELGHAVDPRNIGHDFNKLCEAAGLDHWRPHELRHSAASLMLAAGVPIEVVSNVLGHASIRMTADVYGHILAPQRQAAADAVAGTLWGEG
jgi:integrase